MVYFAPREAETTLPCPKCAHKLQITRSCQEVHLRCPNCKSNYPLADFISKADPAMEKFLENVYCDRI